MNAELFLRYTLELSMILPAALISIIPVLDFQRLKTKYIVIILTVTITTVILSGSALCTVYHLPSNIALIISLPVLFFAYHFCYDILLSKKILCFLNSSMLCGFCTMYSTFVTAPIELGNNERVFRVPSALICLGITFAVGAAFFRTLYKKIPQMLENPTLDKLWIRLIFIPFIMTVISVWMTPVKPENVMVGRLRIVCIVIMLLIPITLWFMCHMMWWIAYHMSETAKLQENLNILKMEEKQYYKTLRYLDETSTLRHDFRHHLLMINKLAEKNEKDKLLEYIRPFIHTTEPSGKKYFENHVLNAVASHYIELAKEQDILIMWGINLPESIPFKESDICSVLGNLLENAIHAVTELPKERRTIHCTITFQREMTFAVHISNEYKGHVTLGKNGLPTASIENHGIGLKSVLNTVERYNGILAIETENGKFDVYLVMYTEDVKKQIPDA